MQPNFNPSTMAPIMGGIFMLVWLIFMGVGLIGWIVVLMSLWRGMKAHESVARSLHHIAEMFPREVQQR